MVRSELIECIMNKFTQLPAEEVEQGVCQILECMSEALSKGKRIEVRGFGSFLLHYHAQHNAHNPRTLKKVISKAKHAVHFKPGKKLRDRINSSFLKNIPIVQDKERRQS